MQYGYGFPAYYYDYTLQNNSNQYDVVSWTWYLGSISGTLFPHPKGAEYVDGYELPLLAAASDDDMQYRSEVNDNEACAPVQVTGVITWSDNHTTEMPVYVPECVIPEPSSLVGLIAGLVGVAGVIRRRRA